MKITILYDNDVWKEGLQADFGFSCLVEAYGNKILFDAGTNGSVLVDNMKKLNIDPGEIQEIFISHGHWDHTGGLSEILALNPVKIYIPPSCRQPQGAKEVVKVGKPLKIHENIFSTGELEGIEQSLGGCCNCGVFPSRREEHFG